MTSAIPLTLVGATGLTGSAALSSLLTSHAAMAITALTRRAVPGQTTGSAASTYTNRVLSDVASAVTATEPLVTPGGVYVSCLGTTLAVVGDFKKQEQIDLVLNRELATRAKKDGAKTVSLGLFICGTRLIPVFAQMILVSAYGASSNSWFAYPRMKGQLEDAVRDLNFDRTVIIRPATLLYEGQREVSNLSERVVVSAIRGMRAVGLPTTFLGVDGAE